MELQKGGTTLVGGVFGPGCVLHLEKGASILAGGGVVLDKAMRYKIKELFNQSKLAAASRAD